MDGLFYKCLILDDFGVPPAIKEPPVGDDILHVTDMQAMLARPMFEE